MTKSGYRIGMAEEAVFVCVLLEDAMKHLERLNARAMYAWNKYIGSFYSNEDREMWAYLYILFANERDTVGCMI